MSADFVGPYPVDDVVERLRSAVPELKVVGRAAELSAAIQNPPPVSAAAFVVLSERGSPPEGTTGIFIQKVFALINVVIFVRDLRGTHGASAAVGVSDLSRLVRLQLAGWSPIKNAMGLEIQAGRAESFRAGELWWQDVFRTQYRLRVKR